MLYRISFIIGIALFLVLWVSSPAVGQALGRVEQTDSNAGDYYYYVQPGSRTIQLHVLGTVQSPGLYEVNDGTSLGQLLALSGGPVMTPRLSRNKRKVNIRLFRPTSRSVEPIFSSEIEDGALYGQQYPTLMEGDILRVDVVERTRFNWRDALQIITATASVVFVIDRARSN